MACCKVYMIWLFFLTSWPRLLFLTPPCLLLAVFLRHSPKIRASIYPCCSLYPECATFSVWLILLCSYLRPTLSSLLGSSLATLFKMAMIPLSPCCSSPKHLSPSDLLYLFLFVFPMFPQLEYKLFYPWGQSFLNVLFIVKFWALRTLSGTWWMLSKYVTNVCLNPCVYISM